MLPQRLGGGSLAKAASLSPVSLHLVHFVDVTEAGRSSPGFYVCKEGLLSGLFFQTLASRDSCEVNEDGKL